MSIFRKKAKEREFIAIGNVIIRVSELAGFDLEFMFNSEKGKCYKATILTTAGELKSQGISEENVIRVQDYLLSKRKS